MKIRMVLVAGCCAVLLAGVCDANAAGKARKKSSSDNAAADNMQCNEVTFVGVITEKSRDLKDPAGKVLRTDKYYSVIDSKKKEWAIQLRIIPAEKAKEMKELVGSKVKIVGMVQGSGNSLLSVKSVAKL